MPRGAFIATYKDCFVVDDRSLVTLSYNFEALRDFITTMPLPESLLELELSRFIAETPITKPHLSEYLLLDKERVKPFRQTLFDSREGLYKTKEEQKTLFLRVLVDLSRFYNQSGMPDEVLERYGDAFKCAHCDTETYYVDIAASQAFCSEACRLSLSLYK